MSFVPLPVDEYGNVSIGFGDSAALDSFQRLRVSQAFRKFDSQQEYGLDTLRSWDVTANGTLPTILAPNGSVTSGSNAVGPRDSNTKMVPITCSSTDTHYAILQSRQYVRYVPGFSHLILITGVFATAASPTAEICVRTSTSGSPSDANCYSQANWYDKFDGTGPSGITLDLTTTQILFIGAQWLGVGRVIVGFDIGGRLYPAMFFNHANVLAVPYTQTFNLPVRMEARTDTTTTITRTGYFDAANGVFLKLTNTGAGGTAYFNCCSVQSEGADEARGYPQSHNPGIASIGVTTRRPVFSIRPSATFQGITNRAHIRIEDFWLTASTNNSIYEVVIGGTLTGASFTAVGNNLVTAGSFVTGVRYKIVTVGTTDFTLIGASANTVNVSFVATGAGTGTGTAMPEYSCAEYDITASAISGGVTTYTGELLTGSGTVRGSVSQGADFRNPLVLSKIDSLTASQHAVSIVCTSVSGTSNVRAGMNWHEQTV